jgi:hypothetical protein
LPQVPQFRLSESVFAQYGAPPSPSQVVSCAPQELAQFAFEHTCPVEHFVPHVPQLFGSLWSWAHVEPHWVVPPPQARPQEPAEHAWPAEQAFPHPPQFVGSTEVSTHLPPQLACVPGQAFASGLPPSDAPVVLGFPLEQPPAITPPAPIEKNIANVSSNQCRRRTVSLGSIGPPLG